MAIPAGNGMGASDIPKQKVEGVVKIIHAECSWKIGGLAMPTEMREDEPSWLRQHPSAQILPHGPTRKPSWQDLRKRPSSPRAEVPSSENE